MKPRLKANRAARELIKAFEPFESEAVQRGSKWIVGYGHRATAKAGVSVSREDAELLLVYDVTQAEAAVTSIVERELPRASRDALISFAASVGPAAFRISDIARHARAGRHEDVADAIGRWNRVQRDGRLVVSERLTARRQAERTLYLEGFGGLARGTGDAPRDEPSIGTLVDVDLVFEEPEADNAALTSAPAAQEPAPEPEAELANDAIDDEGSNSDVEGMPAEPAAQNEPEVEAQSVRVEEPSEQGEASRGQPSQDEAIKAVMARMAGDMAASIPSPPEAGQIDLTPEPDGNPGPHETPLNLEPDTDEVGAGARRLGYSYLTPHSAALELDSAEQTPVQADTREEALEPSAPVFATVGVTSLKEPARTAPPHPADAPARGQGLSGESVGPDHPDKDDTDAISYDDIDLDPALVAGPEAGDSELADDPAPQDQKGGWVYTANLVVGLLMTAGGAWSVWSELDSYMAVGPGYDWGPVGILGGGIILSVGAGWVVIGNALQKTRR